METSLGHPILSPPFLGPSHLAFNVMKAFEVLNLEWRCLFVLHLCCKAFWPQNCTSALESETRKPNHVWYPVPGTPGDNCQTSRIWPKVQILDECFVFMPFCSCSEEVSWKFGILQSSPVEVYLNGLILLGKSTGNHRFCHQIWGFPVNLLP